MQLCLIFTKRNICTNLNLDQLINLSSSSRITKLKDILPWNIYQMISMSMAIYRVMKRVMKYLLLGLKESQWKLRQQHDQNSPYREYHCRTNTMLKTNKSKIAGLWESQSGIWKSNFTIWVRSFDMAKL